jgi:serine protease
MRYQGGQVLVHPRVYIVFWGSEWGAADAHGMPTADPLNAAASAVDFFGRLGGRGDSWSTILTQYCSGTAVNATSCGLRSRHIAPLNSSPLRGWWVDTSPPPGASTAARKQGAFSDEINTALNHFHARDVDDIVVLVLPPGPNTDPCAALHTGAQTAQHGYRAAIVLPYPVPACGGEAPECDLATPAPCLPDARRVITFMASHEYAETLTNPHASSCLQPTGICGWIVTDVPVYNQHVGTFQEIADVCGSSAFIELSGKQFTVAMLWSNSANGGRGGCVSSYISDRKQS